MGSSVGMELKVRSQEFGYKFGGSYSGITLDMLTHAEIAGRGLWSQRTGYLPFSDAEQGFFELGGHFIGNCGHARRYSQVSCRSTAESIPSGRNHLLTRPYGWVLP